MSEHNNILLAPGIVTRLRMVFLSIAIILGSGLAIGAIQLQAVNGLVNSLTGSTVPIFVKAGETERSLKNLLLILQRIESVEGAEALGLLELELENELFRLRVNTDELLQQESKQDDVANLDTALADVQNGAANILRTKGEMIEVSARLSENIAELEKMLASFLLVLEDMSYEVAVAAQRDFRADISGPNIDVDLIKQQFSEAQILANSFTKFTLEVEAVLDLAHALRNIQNLRQLDQSANELRFRVRGLVVLIGLLPEGAARTDLAIEVSELRDFAFSDRGYVAEVASFLRLRKDLAAYKAEQVLPVKAISDFSNWLTNAANGQVTGASEKLHIATNRMTFVVTFVAIVILGAIGLAVLFVVERQINKRMARLTTAVMEIAGGKTAYEVDVSGPDELGKMANALEVFKLNAQELRRSNQELEKFASVAAHDLRSPLRAIQDLAEWTLEDNYEALSIDGRENMTLLQRRVVRMNDLLSDLLKYARVGKDTDKLIEVSIKDIVMQTAELLDPDDVFDITYSGSIDEVTTFATPLRQILMNLINNGIKHHDQPTGKITVSAEYYANRLTLFVRDDGPGIPIEYHEKVFELFQTLRPRDEVEGSGLGLAIIRKLLENHDGEVRIDSDPTKGRGTTFIVELPGTCSEMQATSQAA